MEAFVRPFESADEPLVSFLVAAALEGVTSHRGGNEYLERFTENLDALRAEVSLAVEGRGRELLVGLLDGHLFGFCLIEHAGEVLTVEALYVDPEAREVGLGTSLMEAAEQKAKELGCVRIESLVLPGDRRSKQRAESTGLKARLLILSKALNER